MVMEKPPSLAAPAASALTIGPSPNALSFVDTRPRGSVSRIKSRRSFYASDLEKERVFKILEDLSGVW
ncbi:hypothetical protein SADUNF_Sadunf11G0033500 [Salix dunnii]|uniref:Uncharacterized protein n=1 Tax=Salix dunnii TaxID=1413687 RepID=A0A835JK18_9ROSI|nr:hypothetical protein SADUNF_Sadunf11G0033500 [Salix dunnii]